VADLPPGTDLELELATSADAERWSPYHRVEADPHLVPTERFPDGRPNPAFGDTVGALTHRSRGDGRYVRYRVTLRRSAGATASPVLRRLTTSFIDSRRPGPQAERPTTVEAGSALSPGGLYPRPPVHSRAEWGAEPPVCTYSYCAVTHVAIHHTADVSEYDCAGFDECAADVRAIQAYHMDVNGWCDIGYNYLASSDGALWEGRGGGDDVVGAHDGFNCGSMGVANMGYYHPPYDQLWTEAQIDSVAELAAWKCDQKGIDPFGVSFYSGFGDDMDNLYGHRDVKSTACPGDTIYPRLGELRSRVDDKLTGGGTVLIYDNPDVDRLQGTWFTGTSAPDRYGADYLWTDTGTGDTRLCGWTVEIPQAGTWDVAFWWSQGGNRSPAAELGGARGGAGRVFVVDQQTGGGQWNSIGSLSLPAGSLTFGVRNGGPGGFVVICDALRLTRLSP